MKKITMGNHNPSFEEAIDSFATHCKMKNLSPRTIEEYKTHIAIFRKFYSDDNLRPITLKTIEGFISNLQANNRCSEITINSYLRSIRVFVNWCIEREYIKPFKIPMRKEEEPLIPTYTDGELRVLLKKPDIKTCSFSLFKIWAFSNFMLGTGMRISSAINVLIGDIDFANKGISIRYTKNRRAIIIPLSSGLASVLQEYLLYRKGEPEDYLFCNAYGNKADKRTYQEMLASYHKSRGVNRTSSKLYRHTFAKNWILNGGDIFRLQKILGHRTLEMVKRYVAMFSPDLARDFDKFNPLDNLKIQDQGNRIRMERDTL